MGRVIRLKLFTMMETVAGPWDGMKKRDCSREPLFPLPGNERTNVDEHFAYDERRIRI